jgi:catechol 2,3-dioxygenase-like lactoylglutathione lyase family enzyme
MASLASSRVLATIAVKDLDEAKEFYGQKLGLAQVDENPGGVTYESGGGFLFVYQSGTAGTSQATCASWQVEDVDEAVQELKAEGITFEHYEGMPVDWEGDVAIMENERAAWFKDPSGNILNVASHR